MKNRPSFRRPRHLLSDAAGGLLSFVLEVMVVLALAAVAFLVAAVVVLLV